MVIISATDEQNLNQLLSENSSDLKILYFYIENSAECNQMTDVINELDQSGDSKDLTFVKIDAKKFEEISSKRFSVENVPTYLFYVNGGVIDKLVGANAPLFTKRLNEHKEKLAKNATEDLDTRLQKLIKKAPVMLFMKGSPSVPRCGFSKQVIALLNSHDAKYETFDILEDWDVREGLKKLSNWPTYPQLYISGELIGGLDILKELAENGELDDLLSSAK